MIRGAYYVAFFYIDSLYLIIGFRGILWQTFYPLLTKKQRTFASPKIKTYIALSVQYTASSDILNKATVEIYKFAQLSHS